MFMANDSKTWRCGKYELSFDRPRIMGVLNVTPDSFSDGGEHFDPDAAIEYGLAMLDAGADIIDVGGESTRPGFTPVNPDEEARPRAARGARAGQGGRHRLDRHASCGGCQGGRALRRLDRQRRDRLHRSQDGRVC